MKSKQPIFRSFFFVEITNHKPIIIVADSFGECARKAYLFINKLETKEAHSVISITLDHRLILV